MVEVELPHLTTTEEQGRALFVENCASCHGDNAGGRQGLAPPLVHIYYKQSHHADITFQLAAKNGVRQHHWDFGSMPPVEAVNEVDMKSIISFVRKLQEANGID